MLNQTVRQFFRSYNFALELVLAVGVGLLLGIVALRFSPLLTLGAFVGAGLVFAILKRPEIALLGILVTTSTIVFEGGLPAIPIGIGTLHIPDILLLSSLGLIVLLLLVNPDFKIIRTPLDVPLLVFYSVALLSTLVAVFHSSVEFEEARRGIRGVTYYLTFFAVTNLVREEHQLRFLLKGMVLLATMVAVVMIAQLLVGESVHHMLGSVGTLTTADNEYYGITRIVPPGRSLLLVSFITVTAVLAINKLGPRRMLTFLQWILLGLGVLLTFLRSHWAVVAVAFFVLAYLNRGEVRRRLIAFGLVILVLSTTMILPIVFESPDSKVAKMVKGSFARLSTLGKKKTLHEDSLQWRYVENEYALAQIKAHPLLGLGLGARYRPFDARLDYPGQKWDARGFIHNGHLWVLMTTGLTGYISLMWLSVAFLIRGFRYWRRISDPQMRGIVLGFTLAYLGVLIAAVVNCMFASRIWTPLIGIMMGVNEVAIRKASQEGSVG